MAPAAPGRIGPGGAEAVDEWLTFMHAQGIEHVCCFLADILDDYPRLLESYRDAFGPDRVCHAPIVDYAFVDLELLHATIRQFLRTPADHDELVDVH